MTDEKKTDKTTIRSLMECARDKLKQTPASDATKQLEKDLAGVEKEYDGFKTVLDAFADALPELTGSAYCTAGLQLDEAKTWVDDKIADGMKEALKLSHEEFGTRADEITATHINAQKALNDLLSPLDQANATVDQAAADYAKTKDFQKSALAWYADHTALYTAGKALAQADDAPAAHAHYLEMKAVWDRYIHANFADGPDQMTRETLRGKLTCSLKALICAQIARFDAYQARIDAQTDADDAAADYDAFVVKNGRRDEFLRNVQHVEPVDPEASDASTPETTTSPARAETPTEPAEAAEPAAEAAPEPETA